MHTSSKKIIELTEDDKSQLKHIYLSRIKLFIGVYTVLLFSAILYGSRPFYMGKPLNGHYIWHESGLSKTQMGTMTITFLLIPVLTSGIWIYRKSIYCYHLDIKNGIKCVVPSIVTMKREINTTQQFFIGFDDPNYLHHEVQEDVYNSINLGDIVGVHRAPRSGYTFNMRGRYTAM